MTLQQLQYFCELAKIQHFTKTAAKLHISQPALSYAINELEKDLGTKLFRRSAKKITLTAEGELFHAYIAKAVFLIQEGCERVRPDSGAAVKTVNVGYIHSIGKTLIPFFTELFHNDTVPIHFNFTQALTEDLRNGLISGDFDIIFSVGDTAGAINHPITRQPLCLYVHANHPLCEATQVDISLLSDENWIMVNARSHLRRQVEAAFAAVHTTPRVVLQANSCEAVLGYISKGYGIAILPKTDLQSFPDVVEIDVSGHALERNIVLSWRSDLAYKPLMAKLPEVHRRLVEYAASL